jgi:hypothetical protein
MGLIATPISFLTPFYGPAFFGLDEMHLISLGLSKHFVELFEQYTKNPYASSRSRKATYPFTVPNDALVNAGKDMVSSRPYIPITGFNGNWKNIIERSGRAVDWLDFILYIVPTLLIPKINDDSSLRREAKECLFNLVIVCHILQQWSMTADDIEFIRK